MVLEKAQSKPFASQSIFKHIWTSADKLTWIADFWQPAEILLIPIPCDIWDVAHVRSRTTTLLYGCFQSSENKQIESRAKHWTLKTFSSLTANLIYFFKYYSRNYKYHINLFLPWIVSSTSSSYNTPALNSCIRSDSEQKIETVLYCERNILIRRINFKLF